MLRTPAMFLVLAALAPASLGQAVDAVTPSQGTIGTEVTITGSGFGEKRPKVFLTTEVAQKKVKCKVTSWTDTQIVATVGRIKSAAGEYALTVAPKGGAPAASTFSVLSPALSVPAQASAAAGQTATVSVAHAGKRLRARIGGRKAKVLSIVGSAGTDDGTSTVTLRVPKKLPDGTYDVTVSNPVGGDTVTTALGVTDSPSQTIGKPVITADIDGQAFKSPKKLVTADPAATVLQIIGGGTLPGIDAVIVLQIDVPEPSIVPETNTTAPAMLCYAQEAYTDDGLKITRWSSDNPGGVVTVTVQSSTDEQIAGVFTGTLVHDEGKLPDVKVEGSFIANRP